MPTDPVAARSKPTSSVRRLARSVVNHVPFARSALRRTRAGRRADPRPPVGPPTYIRQYRVSPRPAPAGATWPEPPIVEGASRVIASRFGAAPPPTVFDIDLFESLNAEYASKPLVPNPRANDAAGMTERGIGRLGRVHDAIDLRGKRVLEYGCGGGYEVWLLGHHLDADAHGVDVVERASWAALQDERTHFQMADLGVDAPYPADYFDRIISFSVMEHVEHPFANLTELHRILRPGGLAWISANLYRGPMASHRYREVFFPFPHLLFTDDVFRQFYARRGKGQGKPSRSPSTDGDKVGPAWVNRLSWADYEAMLLRIGFRIRSLRFSERPLDEAFYERFESELGRYPRWDLEKDFFHVVLEKP